MCVYGKLTYWPLRNILKSTKYNYYVMTTAKKKIVFGPIVQRGVLKTKPEIDLLNYSFDFFSSSIINSVLMHVLNDTNHMVVWYKMYCLKIH